MGNMNETKKNPFRRLATGLVVGASSLLVCLPAMASLKAELEAKSKTVAGGAGLNTQESDLAKMVGNIIQSVMGLIGVILVCFFIYAGFLWMTAQGKEEQIEKAKNIIKDSTIGLAILLAAYAITAFVLNAILNATNTG